MHLSFHGGAKEVTGACYLLETPQTKILVDCGMFQGTRECEELNFEKFGFDPSTVDVLLVTHGHLDHVGRIPKLIREGFRGKIYSTAPTKDLSYLILEDALSVAVHEDKELFSKEDIEKTMHLWHEVAYQDQLQEKNCEIIFHNAAHILGSSMIEIRHAGKKFLFTGDLGNQPSELLPLPDTVKNVDYLVIESAYGNKVHEDAKDRVLKLERVVEDITSRGGTLMIPAFATERTQEILFLLNDMLHHRRIPEIPVFVDAPLAIRITAVFEKYLGYYNERIQALIQEHPDIFKFKKLKFTASVDESKAINNVPAPKVIIAGSGMMSGGRILHHARRYLSDPKSILLIIGYQAGGSIGRRLVDGEKQVKIFGETILVEAEIRSINGFSAHADNPQLFAFVESMQESVKRIFVVQGEEAKSLHLAQEVKDRLGLAAEVPTLGAKIELE